MKNNISFYERKVEEYRKKLIHNGEPQLSKVDKENLISFQDKYKNKRCFVIGNGPSLKSVDFSLLEKEYTFAANKIFLMFDKVRWRPTFYTSIDWRVTPTILPEINSDLIPSSTIRLMPFRYKNFLKKRENDLFFPLVGGGFGFDREFQINIHDIGATGRGSVLIQVIQLAFYMGFREIYLIGVDCNYVVKDTVIQEGPDRFKTGAKLYLTSTKDDDSNHFDPRYFGKGSKWHDPNVDEMRRAFLRCRKGVEYYGGKLLNATDGGNLNELERVKFESLFKVVSKSKSKSKKK